MLNVVVLTEWLENIGGTESYAVALATTNKKMGNRVELVCATGRIHSRWRKILIADKISTVLLDLPSRRVMKSEYVLRSISNLVNSFIQKEYDIIHCVPYERTSFILAKMLYYTQCNRKLKIIGQEPSDGTEKRKWWYTRAILNKYIKFFNVIQVHSDGIGKRIERIHGIDNVFTCPAFNHNMLFMLDNSTLGNKRYQNRLRVAYIARLAPEKNPMSIVIAAQSLRDEEIDICIWGSGSLKGKLINAIHQAGLTRVSLKGECFDVVYALSKCDVFISTSIMEGLGLSALEAMAAGKAVILPRIGALYDDMSYLNSFVEWINPDDPQSIITAIKRLMDESDEEFNMRGNLAREYVKKRFSIEKNLDRHNRLYSLVLND